jgi:hypothetical protein
VLGTLGAEGAKEFAAQFNGILEDETTRGKILDALSTFDFKQEGATENFITYLEEIGVTIPEDDLENFIADLNALSAAFRKFDLKTVSEETKKI